MILSNEDIKKYIKEGRISFDPALKEDQIGSASVDLTLGNEFWIFKENSRKGPIIPDEMGQEDVMEKTITNEIKLKSGELILGKTQEKIKIPNDIIGNLEGRSRYARLGLAVHVTSSIVQPGSDNHQILEIVNLSPRPILLRSGLRICQILFHKMESETSRPYMFYGKIAKDQ